MWTHVFQRCNTSVGIAHHDNRTSKKAACYHLLVIKLVLKTGDIPYVF
ncbi:hypothetical protein BSU04_20155 [Caballeronia sordidicola]|uniref:Uncharacterized protein n=1 Tax=Caballeronia sordidicola TaxID=196367 RepID=A0A226WZZ4_CABSO|nr:hypothetical protein BSU04_20155 [Caballeronia sordidicola]